jgi:hypothetical protein
MIVGLFRRDDLLPILRENTLVRGGVIIKIKKDTEHGHDLLPILRENTLIRGGVIIIKKKTRRRTTWR